MADVVTLSHACRQGDHLDCPRWGFADDLCNCECHDPEVERIIDNAFEMNLSFEETQDVVRIFLGAAHLTSVDTSQTEPARALPYEECPETGDAHVPDPEGLCKYCGEVVGL